MNLLQAGYFQVQSDIHAGGPGSGRHKEHIITTAIWKEDKSGMRTPTEPQHYLVKVPPHLQNSENRAHDYAAKKVAKDLPENRKIWYGSNSMKEAKSKVNKFLR